MTLSTRIAALDRARIMRFSRFCVVGGVGFLVDAAVLFLGIHLFAMGPIAARILSFSAAVLVTFELNRRWAFRDDGRQRYATALARYLSVQCVGFLCNFAVYALLYFGLPKPYNLPLLCLAIASGLALFVNYLGASALVFRSRFDSSGETGAR